MAVGGVAEEEGAGRGRAAVGEGLAEHPGVEALHLDGGGPDEGVRVLVEPEGLADAGEGLGAVGREAAEGVLLRGGAGDDGEEHPLVPGADGADDCGARRLSAVDSSLPQVPIN